MPQAPIAHIDFLTLGPVRFYETGWNATRGRAGPRSLMAAASLVGYNATMRALADVDKVREFMRALGHASRGPGRVYLTGGASALLFGWREATVDLDIRLDPEPAGAFEAIAQLKNRLDINIELASPQDFVPELPGWRDRSVFICREGSVEFYHYDFYAQALSKLERGHTRDLADVAAMHARGLFDAETLLRHFESVEAALVRFPSIEGAELRRRVEAFVREQLDG